MAIPVPAPYIARFEKLGFGMFIHWGLYSLLEKGEWAMNFQKIPFAQYKPLMKKFKAEKFDARAIARTAKAAGMNYITLTTRHHDGFSLFDTKGLNAYDAPHSAAGRDLVKEFVAGCRAEGIVPFLYHTTLDWSRDDFDKDFNAYLEYLRQSVEVLCRNYGKIGGLWFDGNWSKPHGTDWKLDGLYGTIRKYQPEAMIINNTGLSEGGKVGHPEIDSVTFEQGRPTPMNREGMDKYVGAEMCQTLAQHWGYSPLDIDYKPPRTIIESLCASRKVGANYLYNIGPTAAGEITEYDALMLKTVGGWVKRAGRVLYDGKPCAVQSVGAGDFALELDGKYYLFMHNLSITGDPNVTVSRGNEGPKAFCNLHKKIKQVRWLDTGEKMTFTQDTKSGLFTFFATGYAYGTMQIVRIAELS